MNDSFVIYFKYCVYIILKSQERVVMTKQNKRWIKLRDRRLPEYLKGMDDFLDFAFSGNKPPKTIRCPCCRCNNVNFKTRDDVDHDLHEWGFEPSYVNWEY